MLIWDCEGLSAGQSLVEPALFICSAVMYSLCVLVVSLWQVVYWQFWVLCQGLMVSVSQHHDSRRAWSYNEAEWSQLC